jgi:phage host-nuclease inhibitor protein Gam
MTFIDELLLEAEIKEKDQLLQMSKIRADQILAAIAVLEQNVEEVNQLADAELKLIEEYRQVELQKIQKKMGWLEYNLEQFIRSTDEKTINLPHGAIKLRLGRDKVEITDLEKFTPFAERKGLLRLIPESSEPDLTKLLAYIKQTGVIPAGVAITPAQTKFSYKTLKGIRNGNGEKISAESSAETE